jgi:hypothetical protein
MPHGKPAQPTGFTGQIVHCCVPHTHSHTCVPHAHTCTHMLHMHSCTHASFQTDHDGDDDDDHYHHHHGQIMEISDLVSSGINRS